jgi:hypothetical protein
MEKMNHYRFRAEFQSDVTRLKEELDGTYRIIPDVFFPDVEVDLYTAKSLEEVKRIMEGLDDGHVMAQTVAHFTSYTGTRVYTGDPDGSSDYIQRRGKGLKK